jgi:uncharacterized protein
MEIVTDINRIKTIAKQKSDENWQFQAFLKNYDAPIEEIDSIVHELYEEVSYLINCMQCANCCKEMYPTLNTDEIRILSRETGISTEQFKKQYLIKDGNPEQSEEIYTFNQSPCPFLKQNLCSNYDCRPDDCRSFPNLHKEEFVFRLFGVIDNYSVCPIVFNVYEQLKIRL